MAKVPASGQVYTDKTLSSYDFVVHGLSNRLFWHCPLERIIDFYSANVTGKHLDIGVATGLLLDRCQFPTTTPELALMDITAYSLEYAAVRLKRYNPLLILADALKPIPLQARSFTSIGLGYLIHCLPGTLEEKQILFDHLDPLLEEGGRVFGTTILGITPKTPWPTKLLLNFYNRVQVFSNHHDQIDGLTSILKTRFTRYSIDQVGQVAFFVGYK